MRVDARIGSQRIIAEMIAAIRTCDCPRPINTDPDGLSLVDCIELGHCACNLGDAVRKAISFEAEASRGTIFDQASA